MADEKVTQLDTSRIVVRHTPEQYALIEKAAILRGESIEEFVRLAVVSKARAIIAAYDDGPNETDTKPPRKVNRGRGSSWGDY